MKANLKIGTILPQSDPVWSPSIRSRHGTKPETKQEQAQSNREFKRSVASQRCQRSRYDSWKFEAVAATKPSNSTCSSIDFVPQSRKDKAPSRIPKRRLFNLLKPRKKRKEIKSKSKSLVIPFGMFVRSLQIYFTHLKKRIPSTFSTSIVRPSSSAW